MGLASFNRARREAELRRGPETAESTAPPTGGAHTDSAMAEREAVRLEEAALTRELELKAQVGEVDRARREAEDGPLPEGYTTKHKGAGKYLALVNGQPLKDANSENPADILFEGKAEAEAALQAYAAQQATEQE